MKMKMLMLGVVVMAVCGNAFGAIRAITPEPATEGWRRKWWMPRYEAQLHAVTNGGAKVVFLGDSITQFWETEGKEALKKYFSEGDRKMLNLGICGDRTEHVLWRITVGRELDGYEAKCVMLMIGTNNTGYPPADTILGIREILRTIRAKQPTAKVVLMPIFPRGRDSRDVNRRRNNVVNKEICKFADGVDVFWCDFNDQFLTADGRLTPEIFPDLLHPAALGYEIWYAAVKPYVDYALSDDRLPAPANRYASVVREEQFRLDEPAAAYPASRISEKKWWEERLLEKRNQIADSNGQIDLVFMGDSITHNWEREGKAALDELRKTYTVLDIGYRADLTEHLLWRAENGELDGYKAKCVMLMIGTNNTYFRKDKPADIAAGVKRILEVVAKKQPQAKVLLLPIFPFGDSPTHENRVNNEAANAIIKTYADGEKVVWVDFNAKFLDEKGNNAKYMPDDNCHPNAAGYKEVWLPSVLPYFQRCVGRP